MKYIFFIVGICLGTVFCGMELFEQKRQGSVTIEASRKIYQCTSELIDYTIEITEKAKISILEISKLKENGVSEFKETVSMLNTNIIDIQKMLLMIEDEILRLAEVRKETLVRKPFEGATNIENRNEDLKKEHGDLNAENKRLEKWGTAINWLSFLLVVLSSFLLITFILHYKKHEKQQRRSELKLKRTNKKLEKKNTELNEKRNKLLELMRELNHRTKNNLHEISSLLLLQESNNTDQTVKSVLQKTRSRVKTMGLIHKQLYRENTEELTTINLAVYVKELLTLIVKDHPTYANLKTSLMLDEIQMEMDLATHIGLVINELTQNSFKHAFKDIATPELAIQVIKTDHTVKIKVQNNGNKLPENFELNNNSNFGLKLVASLIGDGHLEYGNEGGTFFELTFPVEVDEKGVVTKISY